MSGLYVTVKKMIKAKQLQQFIEINDPKTGQSFFGQPGDWQIHDQNGHVFIMTYHEFNQRYIPYNREAFQDFSRRADNYNKRGKLLKDIKNNVLQNKCCKTKQEL